MNFIDKFLNSTTMYRLMLYVLIAFLIFALILCLFGLLPFSPVALVASVAFLISVAWITNTIFAKVFKVPTNVESVYISALILALLITPTLSIAGLGLLFWSGVWVSASKYIFALNKKHLFNPVAISLVLVSIFGIGSASWWVGTAVMLPAVLIGGFLIIKKVQRFNLVISFLLTALLVSLGFGLMHGVSIPVILRQVITDSPIIFFAVIMLTEPLTSPPTNNLRIIYGVLVGLLFNPNIHISGIFSTPELALVAGNVFSYLVSSKQRLVLTLEKRTLIAKDTDELKFSGDKINFKAGQYLEWTLGHSKPDNRGNRRYFTIASSPTEDNYKFGIKFYEPPSSFKTALGYTNVGGQILAGQLSGEFTLPDDKNKKLCFIAGGIGVTPFRSMIKYLTDKGERRDITLLYANTSKEEICYQDIFAAAQKNLGMSEALPGIKVVYQIGLLTQDIIKKEVPDFTERKFYISGPHGMVDAFEKNLKEMGLPSSQIKIDFFPGYA